MTYVSRVGVVAVAVLVGTAACAPIASEGEGTPGGGTAQERVWPPPPAPTKIVLVGSLAGSRDLRGARSLLRRLGQLVIGVSDDRLVRPAGVAASGELVAVADPGSPALFLFDLGANRLRVVRDAGDEALVSPVGVAIAGKTHRVYLSDSYLRRILVYDTSGRYIESWPAADLVRPVALAIDSLRNRVYATDAASHRVHVYDLTGVRLFSFGTRGTGNGEFNWPAHLCVDRGGLVHVVDALNFRVQTFDPEGHFVAQFGRLGDGSGDFARPKGIGVDSRGHVYVVDALFDAVQIFDPEGRFLLTFGSRGLEPGEFWLPTGMAIDTEDRIWVADSYNQRVQEFRFVGE